MSNSTKSSGSASQSSDPPIEETYPEQLHAGKVGLGPNFYYGTSMADKVTGLAEEIHGKIKHNPELVREGRDKRTGETKKRKMLGIDEEDPFASVEDESNSKGKPTSPTSSNATQDQASPSHDIKDAGRSKSSKESPPTHSLSSSKAVEDKSPSHSLNNTGPPSSAGKSATGHFLTSSNVVQNELPSHSVEDAQSLSDTKEVKGTPSSVSSSVTQDQPSSHSTSHNTKANGRSASTEESDNIGFRGSSNTAKHQSPSRSMKDAKPAPNTRIPRSTQVLEEAEAKEFHSSNTDA